MLRDGIGFPKTYIAVGFTDMLCGLVKEFNTPEEETSAMERLLPWSADLPEK